MLKKSAGFVLARHSVSPRPGRSPSRGRLIRRGMNLRGSTYHREGSCSSNSRRRVRRSTPRLEDTGRSPARSLTNVSRLQSRELGPPQTENFVARSGFFMLRRRYAMFSAMKAALSTTADAFCTGTAGDSHNWEERVYEAIPWDAGFCHLFEADRCFHGGVGSRDRRARLCQRGGVTEEETVCGGARSAGSRHHEELFECAGS